MDINWFHLCYLLRTTRQLLQGVLLWAGQANWCTTHFTSTHCQSIFVAARETSLATDLEISSVSCTFLCTAPTTPLLFFRIETDLKQSAKNGLFYFVFPKISTETNSYWCEWNIMTNVSQDIRQHAIIINALTPPRSQGFLYLSEWNCLIRGTYSWTFAPLHNYFTVSAQACNEQSSAFHIRLWSSPSKRLANIPLVRNCVNPVRLKLDGTPTAVTQKIALRDTATTPTTRPSCVQWVCFKIFVISASLRGTWVHPQTLR